MSGEILLLYATHDGHTRRIAYALAGQLIAQGKTVTVMDLGRETPAAQDVGESDTIAIVAPIRFGYHLPSVEKFISTNKDILLGKKLAMVSINLTARKQGKNTPQTNGYMRKWLKRHKIQPALAAVFAGYLNYSLYSWWEKQAIRLIMKMTGGPTDFKAVVDYTDWSMVEAFAKDIASLTREEEEEAA